MGIHQINYQTLVVSSCLGLVLLDQGFTVLIWSHGGYVFDRV